MLNNIIHQNIYFVLKAFHIVMLKEFSSKAMKAFSKLAIRKVMVIGYQYTKTFLFLIRNKKTEFMTILEIQKYKISLLLVQIHWLQYSAANNLGLNPMATKSNSYWKKFRLYKILGLTSKEIHKYMIQTFQWCQVFHLQWRYQKPKQLRKHFVHKLNSTSIVP